MAAKYNRFQVALDVQDACNMRAPAREFVKVVDDAMEELQNTGEVWRDPAVVLFVNKLDSLSLSSDHFATALDKCRQRSDEMVRC